MSDALPTPESQIESLQRELAEKETAHRQWAETATRLRSRNEELEAGQPSEIVELLNSTPGWLRLSDCADEPAIERLRRVLKKMYEVAEAAVITEARLEAIIEHHWAIHFSSGRFANASGYVVRADGGYGAELARNVDPYAALDAAIKEVEG